jgi:hypothetical protein
MYQDGSDDTYAGMSIIPEQHEDIPLFAGLKPREHEYVIEGNRWEEVYRFYLSELPRHGWRAEYEQSSDDAKGFRFRWRKPGFDGELWIHGHYNQAEDQTEVIFDNIPIHVSTNWMETVPEKICVYANPNNNKCFAITDKRKITELVRMINEAIDTETLEPRKTSRIIDFGGMRVQVHYEADQSVYLESEKGRKRMKPEAEFFQMTNLPR